MAKPVFLALKKHFPKAKFRGYDPVVSQENIKNFGLNPYSSLKAVFNKSHLVFILNNHPEFSAMPIESLAELMASPGLIYDFWNSFFAPSLHLPPNKGYMALGSHAHLTKNLATLMQS
jgi:UDP-glucose 6-dehydrogenase